MVDQAALSAWSFPLMPVWLGIQYICISLSFDKFFNLQSILIINWWSNFLFFSDSNTDSEAEKTMNLLFLDSDMKSRAILIAQACALNIEVSFGRCVFKNISFMYCSTSYYFIHFTFICEDVQVFRIFSLTFSNSSWKISGWVLFLWNSRSVKIIRRPPRKQRLINRKGHRHAANEGMDS